MFEVVMMGFLIDVIQFISVGFLSWAGLKFLDDSLKVKFRDAYAKMSENPIALALYHGLRLIAVVYLFGTVAG